MIVCVKHSFSCSSTEDLTQALIGIKYLYNAMNYY